MSRYVAFDLESYLISPSLVAPPCVVGSFAFEQGESGLIPGLEVGDFIKRVLREGYHVVGQNTSFDTFIVAQEWPELRPLIIRAYDEGRIHDTQLREQLLDIRRGTFKVEEYEDEFGEPARRPIGYSLAEIASRRTPMILNKGADSWRLRYNELHGVPLAQWPREATEYATDDAKATLAVFLSQQEAPGDREYLDRVEPDQTRAAFALRAIGSRGVCVDMDAVDSLETKFRAERDAIYPELVAAGIYRAAGTRDMKKLRALVQASYESAGEKVPVTKTGEVQTSASVLKESNDPTLVRLAEFNKTEKLLTSFLPGLRVGAHFPLTCEYQTIVESGRTSCRGIKYGKSRGPQLQNLPRANGIRECFVPRPGYYYCSVDYSQLELCTLAQVVYDMGCGSVLRDAINADLDLHMHFAAIMRGWDYDAVVKDKKKEPYKSARQGAKAANFGFPGGLGARKFVTYARDSYGVALTEEQARTYQEMWRRMWVDAYEYQRRTGSACDSAGFVGVVVDRTGFARGGCRYTEACNTQFQHLAAAGAKRACWRLVKESAVSELRPLAFIHDEVIAEVPIDVAHELATLQAKVMREEMSALVPDVKISADPALMERWYKEAETVYDANGLLIPWTPKK